jgi:hypothetical protein
MVSLLRTCYAETAPPEATGQARGGEASAASSDIALVDEEELDLTREGPARYLAYAARVKKFLAVKYVIAARRMQPTLALACIGGHAV